MTIVDARSRFFIVLTGLCFICMLGVSLYHRFTNPGLTINTFAVRDHPAALQGGSDNVMNAIGQLMQTVARNPSDENAILQLVENLMAAGQWETAENFAQKALALNPPDNPNLRILYLRAIIYHNMGRQEQAAELLEKLLEKEENPSARYSLGILYTHFLNKPELGREQFRKGINSGKSSASLNAAMQEELDKIPIREPEKQPENVQHNLSSSNNGNTD